MQKIKDERVTTQRRKIDSEAYHILIILLMVGLFVEEFIFNAPFKHYALTFGALVFTVLYSIFRYLMTGLSIYNSEKPAKWLPLAISVISGLGVAIIQAISNYSLYSEHYQGNDFVYFIANVAITFFSATLFSYFVVATITKINQQRQKNIQKKMDQEEE